MSDTFSSPDGFLNRHISPINSSLPSYLKCYITKPGSLIIMINLMLNTVILFPLCIFILKHGVQEWQKQRSSSSAASMSHCDCFTYHMVVMELIGVSGCLICCCGIYREDFNIISAGFFPLSVNYYGQALLHALTCVERYLAVVHPITYLSLRQERGIRIRNIIIGCVWLGCFGLTAAVMIDHLNIIMDLYIMTIILVSISFCSLAVLCVLIRAGPGEQGGDRRKVDQSKQKAFYTIVVILVALVLRFVWCLIWACNLALGHNECIILALDFWFNLPSSLALPLLFLYRVGKFKCCKKNNQQG